MCIYLNQEQQLSHLAIEVRESICPSLSHTLVKTNLSMQNVPSLTK